MITKKPAMFTIDEEVMNKFRSLSDVKCTSMSALVEMFIRYYVINEGNIELNFTKKGKNYEHKCKNR